MTIALGNINAIPFRPDADDQGPIGPLWILENNIRDDTGVWIDVGETRND